MTEAEYIRAVQTLLRRHGMDWARPASEIPKGRAFTNIAAGISAVSIIEPAHLTPRERVRAVKRLQKQLG